MQCPGGDWRKHVGKSSILMHVAMGRGSFRRALDLLHSSGMRCRAIDMGRRRIGHGHRRGGPCTALLVMLKWLFGSMPNGARQGKPYTYAQSGNAGW